MPPEEFDLEIEFTPIAGSFSFIQQFPVAGRSITWEYDTKPGKKVQFISGFARLDGKAVAGSLESLKLDLPLLNNGTRYRSRIEVRRDSLRVLLDEKELRFWQGDLTRFSASPPRDDLPDPQRLVISTVQRAVTFHKITVYEVTGRGKVLTGGTTANGPP